MQRFSQYEDSTWAPPFSNLKLNESFLHRNFLPALDFFLILRMNPMFMITVMMTSNITEGEF